MPADMPEKGYAKTVNIVMNGRANTIIIITEFRQNLIIMQAENWPLATSIEHIYSFIYILSIWIQNTQRKIDNEHFA